MSGKTQMKNKKGFGEWIRSRKGQKMLILIAFYDNSADAVTGIYLCSVFGNV